MIGGHSAQVVAAVPRLFAGVSLGLITSMHNVDEIMDRA